MTEWVETTPLRYDNELDNELESIPNTEKEAIPVLCASCQKSLNLATFKPQGGHTLLTVVCFLITIIGNSTWHWGVVGPGTGITQTSSVVQISQGQVKGQVEDPSCIVFEPRRYKRKNIHVRESKKKLTSSSGCQFALEFLDGHVRFKLCKWHNDTCD